LRPYVDLESITRRYGDFTLGSISLKMGRGSVFTLMGPSGSGKTSLLRVISGLDVPESGRIYVNQEDVTNLPPNKRNIGLIFQDLALFPHMSAFDNIAFGLRSRRLGRTAIDAKVEEMAGLLGISKLLERRPGEMSGGERQRVALARSLVVEPSLLLMDEPLSSLDPQLRLRVRSELKALIRGLSLTIIYVTHDLEDGLYLGDYAGYMSGGKILESDTVEQLYINPGTRELAEFLGYNVIELNGYLLAVHPRDLKIVTENQDISGTVKSFGFEGTDIRIDASIDEKQFLAALVPFSDVHKKLEHGIRLGFRISRSVRLDPGDKP
jgi:ABC-type Fe3+/spermidine/putrescine transport system ATPase subunit